MSHSTYDVIIIGAGPAGSVAARQIAQVGASVLLLDKAVFPRPKVCGCCVNRAALAALGSIGLISLLPGLGAVPLRRFHFAASGRGASVAISPGVAVSRSILDHALVDAAVAAGVTFRDGTCGRVGPVRAQRRLVYLRGCGQQVEVAAQLVLVADGLAGRSSEQVLTPSVVQGRSRIGVAAIGPAAPAWCEPGTIYMACERHGYVGLVRLENDLVNVAAAFDPAQLKRAGGPGPLAEATIQAAGLGRIGGLAECSWLGTTLLSRRRASLGAERVLVLGDAAGYVEPFTGEGITWAVRSAIAIAPLACAATLRWRPQLVEQWARTYRRLVLRRQWLCRSMRYLLRYPRLARSTARVLSAAPQVASLADWSINGRR